MSKKDAAAAAAARKRDHRGGGWIGVGGRIGPYGNASRFLVHHEAHGPWIDRLGCAVFFNCFFSSFQKKRKKENVLVASRLRDENGSDTDGYY